MQTESRPSIKKIVIGITLIAISIIALLLSFRSTHRQGFIDYPCGVGHDPKIEINSATKAIYCISITPRDTLSGAGIYAWGSSKTEEFSLSAPPRARWHSTLDFEVDRPLLIVSTPNAYSSVLGSEETFYRVRAAQTLNPWLLMSARFFISNEGMMKSTNQEVLQIGGSVIEGWLPGPLGALIYGIGIILVLFELGKLKRTKELAAKLPLVTSTVFSNAMQIIGWFGVGTVLLFMGIYWTNGTQEIPFVESGASGVHEVNIVLLFSVSLLCCGFFITQKISRR